jgi:mono/diheme cytochrome c family protein
VRKEVALLVGIWAIAAVTATIPCHAQDDRLQRGAYLARAAGCEGCHTSEQARPFAGGRGVPSPFGTIVAPNLTPDRETGIGLWSENAFLAAVQQGVRPDGSHLYPAMPYDSFTLMSREDVLAIRAHLMAQRPVHAASAATTLPFPWNQRWLIGAWKVANFRDGRFVPRADKSERWNRGAYLVEAVAACGRCHTPRTLLLGLDRSRPLGGGTSGPWQAYNVSSDPVSGIGAWGESELQGYLATGAAPRRAYAAGPMGEVVEHGMRHLDPGDLEAIVTYLREVPRQPGLEGQTARFNWGRPSTAEFFLRGVNQVSISNVASGAELYSGACASCHGSDGSGSRDGAYPPLYRNTTTGAPSPANLILVILNGVRRQADGRVAFMPGFGQLDDEQVSSLAAFIRRSFGNPAGTPTPEMVAALRRGQPGEPPTLLAQAAPAISLAAIVAIGGLAALTRRRRRRNLPA